MMSRGGSILQIILPYLEIVVARKIVSLTRRERPWPRLTWLAAAAAVLASVAALTPLGAAHPVLLINITPSEPEGLYLVTRAAPAPGRLIAFHTPAAAFPYADARLSYLHRTTILKSVAAVPGDKVCSLAGRLKINGRNKAGIAARDPRGVALPHWEGCHRLTPGELFVFSNRTANSFDSRYFGPVRIGAVIGVYAPFLTVSGLA